MLKFKTINIFVLILVVVFQLISLPLLCYVILCLLWLIITIIGSLHIRWDYHLDSLSHNYKTSKNQVAITFDDGPNPEFTPRVLDLLKRNNAKATFFCVGKHIEDHPELLKRIISEGHTIGNHTFSHSNYFGFLTTKKTIKELELVNKLVHRITGLTLCLFRPPFGVTNPKIKKALDFLDLLSIGWSVRSLDTTSKSKQSILKFIEKKIQKGDVILLHDTSEKSVDILEQLLLFLKNTKFEAVTIDSLLKIKPYA